MSFKPIFWKKIVLYFFKWSIPKVQLVSYPKYRFYYLKKKHTYRFVYIQTDDHPKIRGQGLLYKKTELPILEHELAKNQRVFLLNYYLDVMDVAHLLFEHGYLVYVNKDRRARWLKDYT